MKLYVQSNGEPFTSYKGNGRYIYARSDEGRWHPVYIDKWPKLKLGAPVNPIDNARRDEKAANSWKLVKLPKEVVIE